MPLAQLLRIPQPARTGLHEWTFWHAKDHGDIVAGVLRYAGQRLTTYLLDPLPQDARVWLQNHQQAHNDMNSFLSLPGSDLQDVNFSDPQALDAWLYLNFRNMLRRDRR